MSSNVSDFIAIVVPYNANTTLLAQEDELTASLQDAIAVCVKVCGGATVTPITGLRHGDTELFEEEGERYQFNFPRSKFAEAQDATRHIVDALFLLGEEAVFRERHYSESGYKATILYRELPPQLTLDLNSPPIVRGRPLPDLLMDDQSARHVALTNLGIN